MRLGAWGLGRLEACSARRSAEGAMASHAEARRGVARAEAEEATSHVSMVSSGAMAMVGLTNDFLTKVAMPNAK